MKFSTTKASAVLAISSVFFLGACGGGGGGTSTAGGGGGGAPAGSALAPSSITSANVREVSAQAFSAATGLNGQVNTAASSNVLLGVDIEDGSSGLLGVSMQQLYTALDARAASNLVVGVTGSETLNCSGGGTLSVSYSVASETTLSNGDSLTIAGSNCVENGQKLNGSLSFTFSNLSGTVGSSSAWSATLALKFGNLSIESGGETTRANGDLTLSYNQTGPGKASYVASGSSLQMVLIKSGTTTDRTLSAFSDKGSVNGSAYTFESNFTLAGNFPKLGNTSFTVKTNTPFNKNGIAFPHAGSMTVTATDKTTATLTVLDSSNIRIEMDKNGDGSVDETVNTTWTALKALL